VRFADRVDEARLSSLPSVQRMTGDGVRFTFTVSGSLDPVLGVLADHPVAELEITRPSLDEAFAAYYGGTTEEEAVPV
jgi:hypothetical protein